MIPNHEPRPAAFVRLATIASRNLAKPNGSGNEVALRAIGARGGK